MRAALRILEAIEELDQADPGLGLQVRIGITTGEAVVALGARPEQGEGIVTGDVVNTALNRGGDRSANNALWRIVIVRMGRDPLTQRCVTRRTEEGLSKGEIIRCLKRYVAREVFTAPRGVDGL